MRVKYQSHPLHWEKLKQKNIISECGNKVTWALLFIAGGHFKKVIFYRKYLATYIKIQKNPHTYTYIPRIHYWGYIHRSQKTKMQEYM